MSLLAKLTKALRRNTTSSSDRPTELETLIKDSRLHTLYLIAGEDLARLRLNNGLTGSVKDVSYGGMAVKFLVDDPSSLQLPDQFTAELQVLDRSIECTVSYVRSARSNEKNTIFAGLLIQHNSAETLIFLRDLIEPLRCGKSLVAIDPVSRHERYQGLDWACLRGEGPTDLILRLCKDGASLQEALLTFRISDSYCELSYKQNTLRTGRIQGERDPHHQVPSARMASTAEIDPEVLRQGICILLGASGDWRHAANLLLAESLKHLKVHKEIPAA